MIWELLAAKAIVDEEESKHVNHMQDLGTSSAMMNGQLVPQARSFLYIVDYTGPVIQGFPYLPAQSVGSSQSTGSSCHCRTCHHDNRSRWFSLKTVLQNIFSKGARS